MCTSKTGGNDFEKAFDIHSKDGKHRIYKTDSKEKCKKWIDSINETRNNSIEPEIGSAPESTNKRQGVLYITVKRSGKECVVARNKPFNKSVVIPGRHLSKSDCVIIALADGGVVTLDGEDRLDVFVGRGPRTKSFRVHGSNLPTEVNIAFEATRQYGPMLAPAFFGPLVAAGVLLAFAVPVFLRVLFSKDDIEKVLDAIFGSHQWLAVEPGAEEDTMQSLMAATLGLLLCLHSLHRCASRFSTDCKSWEITVVSSSIVGKKGDKVVPMPARFMDSCIGNVSEAHRNWKETCDWRKKKEVDSTLTKIQPHFEVIKKRCVYFLPGTTADGQPMLYLRPGSFDLQSLLSECPSITQDSVLDHFVFLMEYMFTLIWPSDKTGRMTLILDIRDVTFKQCSGRSFELWRELAMICHEHYPERCQSIVAIGNPSVFKFLKKMSSLIISPVTMKKVKLVEESEIDNADWLKNTGGRSKQGIDMRNLTKYLKGDETIDTTESFTEESAFMRFAKNLNRG
uniref:CRAL-TRIO domain-containing protein n=1 Tax=Octactis speculum TaxID=3111310 RepID=A0A7S2ARM4_9STRA